MRTLILLCVMLAAPAWARLGETLEQCSARYGKPVQTDTLEVGARFEQAGWCICAWFDEAGKCDYIVFTKVGPRPNLSFQEVITQHHTGADISREELDALLAANAGEGLFHKVTQGLMYDDLHWMAPGKRVICTYFELNDRLCIGTPKGWEEEAKREAARQIAAENIRRHELEVEAAKKKAKLKGF